MPILCLQNIRQHKIENLWQYYKYIVHYNTTINIGCKNTKMFRFWVHVVRSYIEVNQIERRHKLKWSTDNLYLGFRKFPFLSNCSKDCI